MQIVFLQGTTADNPVRPSSSIAVYNRTAQAAMALLPYEERSHFLPCLENAVGVAASDAQDQTQLMVPMMMSGYRSCRAMLPLPVLQGPSPTPSKSACAYVRASISHLLL